MSQPAEEASAAQLAAGRRSPAGLAHAAAGCRACGLWQWATQTVFGEGPADAELMLVGEQPGDREDRGGRPFVGPARRAQTCERSRSSRPELGAAGGRHRQLSPRPHWTEGVSPPGRWISTREAIFDADPVLS